MTEDILKEEFPEIHGTYGLDLYVNAILNLHAELDVPQFIERYIEVADQVQGRNPDMAEFLKKAEGVWQDFEKKEFGIYENELE